MSYPFENEKIVEVVYTNPERDTIEIIWADPENDSEFLSFCGEASDVSLQKWLSANEYTDEVIYDATRDKNAVDSKNFHQMVSAYSKPFLNKIAADYEERYKEYDQSMSEKVTKLEEHWRNRFREISELKGLENQLEAQIFDQVSVEFGSTPNPKKTLRRAIMKSSEIIEAILEQNSNEEELFKAKLAIFEIENIKKSKDRELKTAIRKSKTLFELFATLNGKI